MKQTIIAKSSDLRDEFCLGIIVESPPSIAPDSDPISALQKAAREFAGTDGGKKVLENTNGCFNWGDLVENIPTEICEKYGFRIIDTFQTDLIVAHDEQLIF